MFFFLFPRTDEPPTVPGPQPGCWGDAVPQDGREEARAAPAPAGAHQSGCSQPLPSAGRCSACHEDPKEEREKTWAQGRCMTLTLLLHLLLVFIRFLLEFQPKCGNRGKVVQVWRRAMQRKKKKKEKMVSLLPELEKKIIF